MYISLQSTRIYGSLTPIVSSLDGFRNILGPLIKIR